MNITVKVDEISLDTAVAEVFAYDEDGDAYARGERTVGDLVAGQIVDRLVRGANTGWPGLVAKVTEIRNEVIRETVRPQIEEAVAAPFRKTNSYGEPVGEPTTLRQLIVDEARKAVNEPADRYSSSTFLQQAVRAEVQKALAKEIADAVKQAREQVAAEVGQHVAAAVQAGLKAR